MYTQNVSWDDIEPAARNFLCVWANEPGAVWARRAWRFLREEGLTQYQSDLDRTRVLLRYAVLEWVYRDFMETVHEENFPRRDQWRYWLDLGSEATPLHLVRLCPSKHLPTSSDKDDILRSAFGQLLEEAKPEVYEALLHRFGGVIGLYLHLLYTSRSQLDKLYVIDSETTKPEIVSERRINNVVDEVVDQHGENWWRDELLYPFLKKIPGNVSKSARNGFKYPIDR